MVGITVRLGVVIRRIVPVGLVLLLIGVACGGDDAPAATAIPTVVPTEMPVPLPTVPPRESFDPSAYTNGDLVLEFLEGVVSEREFPLELLPGAPELSKVETAEIWREFLADTRVVIAGRQLVVSVDDYRSNGTTLTHYARDVMFRNGAYSTWAIESTDLTTWNASYLYSSGGDNPTTYVSRGYDGTSSPTLNPPDGGKPLRAGFDGQMRVYEYPECPAIEPILDLPPGVWDVLGLGNRRTEPEALRFGMTQLPEDQVLKLWNELVTDTTTFGNLNAVPMAIFCSDHTGIESMNRFAPHEYRGRPFTWSLRDAREVDDANGVWLDMDYNDDTGVVRHLYLDLRLADDPLRNRFVLNTLDCSVEEGIAYMESAGLLE
jgi:hypothetical protein